MSQLDIASSSITVSYVFLYFFIMLVVTDLFQVWFFGIFQFVNVQIDYFIYNSLFYNNVSLGKYIHTFQSLGLVESFIYEAETYK